jgi:hypothetical protein
MHPSLLYLLWCDRILYVRKNQSIYSVDGHALHAHYHEEVIPSREHISPTTGEHETIDLLFWSLFIYNSNATLSMVKAIKTQWPFVL